MTQFVLNYVTLDTWNVQVLIPGPCWETGRCPSHPG